VTTPPVTPQPLTTLTAGLLPTTGVNLLGLVGAAFGVLGAGIGALLLGRRRPRPSSQ
jgi:hypothetical protein